MEEKIYRTSEQQVEILKGRGLEIENQEEAIKILNRTNYYNLINGYKTPFLEDRYIEGAKLSEIKALYRFDKSISRLFLSAILEIENTLKTIISDVFSSEYGHKDCDYLRFENLCSSRKKNYSKNKLLSKLKEYISNDKESKAYLLHYKYNHKYVPLWVLSNYMTLNDTVWLYEVMKKNDRIKVAKKLSDNAKVMDDKLELMLFMIRDYRNIAAHDERFYDYQTKNTKGIRYKLEFGRKNYGVFGIGEIYTSLFTLTLSLKILLLEDEFNDFFDKFILELEHLDSALESINLKVILNKMDFINEQEELDSIKKIETFFNKSFK